MNFDHVDAETALAHLAIHLRDDVAIDAIGALTPWLVIASPEDLDYAKVYTLAGRETPVVSSKVGGATEVKGILFDIEHYFVVKFLDWRGFYKTL